MAKVNSRLLFLTTSPRTPEKMIPEIALLIEHFSGRLWNKNTQCDFMEVLRKEQFFNGQGKKDPSFSARDRINRAPKSLGFITLEPVVSLTKAGEALLNSSYKEEVFLRQMLKFQIPSPYHKPTSEAAKFCIKPYLEMLRLVRIMGTLKFDELQMFGMQLTDWHDFDKIVSKIDKFRIAKVKNQQSYRLFKTAYLRKELRVIYAKRIAKGNIKTRESTDASINKFLQTQSNNMRDYADACFRYLRATGLVNVSHTGKSLSIVSEREKDVDYILATIDRTPCFVTDTDKYVAYIGSSTLPKLPTDEPITLTTRLKTEFPNVVFDEKADIEALKELWHKLIISRREVVLREEIEKIKNYRLYEDIQNTFEQIKENILYDTPLMLEWNVWRAMTMLDGGDVKANLHFDDFGKPLSTAQGNMADIVCDYGDFMLIVEVTMASGQRQYEMEGEPISRHLGNMKKAIAKPCYALFIAPKINEACIAHFYLLHKENISYYGGRSIIVPLSLNVFQKMLENSRKAGYVPKPEHVSSFFEHSVEIINNSSDELQWFKGVQQSALEWLQESIF